MTSNAMLAPTDAQIDDLIWHLRRGQPNVAVWRDLVRCWLRGLALTHEPRANLQARIDFAIAEMAEKPITESAAEWVRASVLAVLRGQVTPSGVRRTDDICDECGGDANAGRCSCRTQPPGREQAPAAYRKFLEPQYDYSDRYRYKDATSIGAPEGWEPLYAAPPAKLVGRDELLGRIGDWLNAYMHDRESYDEATKLLAEVGEHRPTLTKGGE